MKLRFFLPLILIQPIIGLDEKQSINNNFKEIEKITSNWNAKSTLNSDFLKNDILNLQIISSNSFKKQNSSPVSEKQISLKNAQQKTTYNKSLKNLWENIVSNIAPWKYEQVLKNHQNDIKFLKDLFKFLKIKAEIYSDHENGDAAIFINKKELEDILRQKGYFNEEIVNIQKKISNFQLVEANIENFLSFWNIRLDLFSQYIITYKMLFNKEISKIINDESQNIKITLNTNAQHVSKGNLSLKKAKENAQKIFETFVDNILKHMILKEIDKTYQKTFSDIVKSAILLNPERLKESLSNLSYNIEKSNIENFVSGHIFRRLSYKNIENVKFLIKKFLNEEISSNNIYGSSDYTKILKCIANWKDNRGFKNLKITKNIKQKFYSLRNLFGIPYPEIKNINDIINIKTSAQQISASALANIKNYNLQSPANNK